MLISNKHYAIFSVDKSDGLCCQLTKSCPKEPEPVPFKDIEVERSQLKLDKKLGHGNFGEVFAGRTNYGNIFMRFKNNCSLFVIYVL